MSFRTLSEHYTAIADKLIKQRNELAFLREQEVTICYLSSEWAKKSRGKVIFAECERVPDKYKWAVPCDFTITVFEPNVERFTDEQLEVLILHELLHVGVDTDGGETKYYVIPHDVEEFRAIIDEFGMDWSNVET